MAGQGAQQQAVRLQRGSSDRRKGLRHLKLAHQNIAAVIAEKIANGAKSRSEASLVARRLMFDNPRDFYLSKVL
jgi:hypothetical protein